MLHTNIIIILIGAGLLRKFVKTLNRILRGTSDANIGFEEIRTLLVHLGFDERVRGDQHIFSRAGVPEILNLQPRNGQAKPYQVRQVREVIVAHGLAGPAEGEEDGE